MKVYKKQVLGTMVIKTKLKKEMRKFFTLKVIYPVKAK
jgi:hypothetical protein